MRMIGPLTTAPAPSRLSRSVLAVAAGLLAMLALPSLAADVAPDAIVLRSRVFDIPFHMEGASSATTVKLYVSTDRGQTWKIVSEQQIPVSSFHFEADTDGEHWFAHATDADAIADPPSGLSAERKIFIDSTGPAIEITGEANLEGVLAATLTLSDPHDLASLRILYYTDVDRKWKPVANESVDDAGSFQIRPESDWRQMSVHVTATDTLGNASVEAKIFRRPRIAAKTTNQLRIQPAAGPSDPPSFLLGPGRLPATEPPASSPQGANTPQGAGALQGARALQAPATSQAPPPRSRDAIGQATRNPHFPLPAPQANASTGTTESSPRTFGSGFRHLPMSKQAASAPATPPGARSQSPGLTLPETQLSTLPAAGVTAKVTPQGIEVLPAPEPESQSQSQSQSAAENVPVPTPTPDRQPSLQGPTPPSRSQDRSLGDTTTESRLTPATPSAEPNQTTAPKEPRSLAEAMRPLVPESIPTPTPSSAADEARRVEADRVESVELEKQQRYDRIQLARNVPFRFSNSNRFSLEYELEAVADSGVESVELYGSVDAGRNWKRWGADPDRTSPFDIETKGEGVFAFCIVVIGNNGLASPRPLSGDTPDIAVIVDQTKPRIKITSARYGEGNRTGSLVIRYECSDDNLMSRPVSIAFSDSIDGPWTTIAAGLQNDGLHVWPADPKLPPQIYLRIDATDQAGNTGTYLLEEPIATSGLAPRARILGFRSR